MDKIDVIAIDGTLSSDVLKRLMDLHLLAKHRPRGKPVAVVGDLPLVKGLIAHLKDQGLRVRFYPWRTRYPPGLISSTEQVLSLGTTERMDRLLVQFNDSNIVRFVPEEDLPYVAQQTHSVSEPGSAQ